MIMRPNPTRLDSIGCFVTTSARRPDIWTRSDSGAAGAAKELRPPRRNSHGPASRRRLSAVPARADRAAFGTVFVRRALILANERAIALGYRTVRTAKPPAYHLGARAFRQVITETTLGHSTIRAREVRARRGTRACAGGGTRAGCRVGGVASSAFKLLLADTSSAATAATKRERNAGGECEDGGLHQPKHSNSCASLDWRLPNLLRLARRLHGRRDGRCCCGCSEHLDLSAGGFAQVVARRRPRACKTSRWLDVWTSTRLTAPEASLLPRSPRR
jgi:hypothetical protein